eukprot:CAMPEP_0185024860 /NCGR_PEP_ID=MMETSP1103-20130426/8041_1 /TAXON_ID=36769 /ORGANISM="Paraphysomonas bandaiensis, Strain Caron Lab Isolate" /LENGTH=263 /DNA_ID=CAMNT_0027557931 /DNA_START=200 /DNA_END=991 /DNA_ORIENTATION=+
MGATFDLTDLVRTSDEPSYMVTDGDIPCTTDVVEQNFTYMFNICGTVAGGVPSACATLTGLSKAGALQIDKNILSDPSDDYCFLAGAYGDQATTLGLLDQEDPTKGLALTYYGAYCNSPAVQRRFRIELICADKLNPIPTHALEYEHCSYTVTMPSVYGCPLECPVANRELCGGNGHCAYDQDKASARCFCNHGYKGKDCSTKSSSSGDDLNYSPALLGLIITLFVIIALLVGGIFLMIRQLAAYKEDMTNYQALKGDESEAI